MFKKLFSMFTGTETTKANNEQGTNNGAVEEMAKVIIATQTGEAVSITEVPDPVFSEKMMGDGFAIIPTENKVCSPVSGEVVSVTKSLHAYGIRTEEGLEVLVHVGLDTVALNGEGFKSSINCSYCLLTEEPSALFITSSTVKSIII